MKRILVPVDFSKQADCAVRTAANIARKSGAEIFLLHMLNLPANESDVSAHGDASSPAKVLYLQKVHEKFKELLQCECLKGLKVSEEVRFHKTFAGIIEYSHELNTNNHGAVFHLIDALALQWLHEGVTNLGMIEQCLAKVFHQFTHFLHVGVGEMESRWEPAGDFL